MAGLPRGQQTGSASPLASCSLPDSRCRSDRSLRMCSWAGNSTNAGHELHTWSAWRRRDRRLPGGRHGRRGWCARRPPPAAAPAQGPHPSRTSTLCNRQRISSAMRFRSVGRSDLPACKLLLPASCKKQAPSTALMRRAEHQIARRVTCSQGASSQVGTSNFSYATGLYRRGSVRAAGVPLQARRCPQPVTRRSRHSAPALCLAAPVCAFPQSSLRSGKYVVSAH